MSLDAISFTHWLREEGSIISKSVERAFLEAPRADFVLPRDVPVAYENHPLSIGYGQTISQPSVVALMLELLRVETGNDVLDIGSGTGWTTALLASLTGEFGKVTGLEIVPELVTVGTDNLAKCDVTNAKIFQARDGVIGMPSHLFNRILVSASASEMPWELLDQLRPEGRLVIPVGTSLFLCTKDRHGELSIKEFPGFSFVPLRKKAPLEHSYQTH